MSPQPPAGDVPDRFALLERLFDVARDGLYAGQLDPSHEHAETILVANPSLKRLLGCAADAAPSACTLFGPSRFDESPARERLLRALLDGPGVSDYLVQLRRDDGTPVWIELTANVEAEPSGSLRIDALVRDVTARRAREDRGRELYLQLVQSEQLAAIDRTLADMAHELKNPLATIVAWAERLAELQLGDRAGKGVTEILSAAERASRIIRNVLHGRGRQTSTRALVDVNTLVAETLHLRQHDQLAMNVVTLIDAGDNLPKIFADGHQIQQLLLNVVMNAEQATSTAQGHGQITIRTSCDERRQMAIIEIADDGPGVPDTVRSRIFDPFFTTKPAGTGTGLGLAVAQALAHEHGGSIRLAPARATGATFIIELPTRNMAALI
jgi:signal transduction histidine kinase